MKMVKFQAQRLLLRFKRQMNRLMRIIWETDQSHLYRIHRQAINSPIHCPTLSNALQYYDLLDTSQRLRWT